MTLVCSGGAVLLLANTATSQRRGVAVSAESTQRFSITFHNNDGWAAHYVVLHAGDAVRFEAIFPNRRPPNAAAINAPIRVANLDAVVATSASTVATWPAAVDPCDSDTGDCHQKAVAVLNGAPDSTFTYLTGSTPLPAGPPLVVLHYNLESTAFNLEGSAFAEIFGAVKDQVYWLSAVRLSQTKSTAEDWFAFVAPTTARYAIALHAENLLSYPVPVTARLQIHPYRSPAGSFDNGSGTAAFPFRGGSWRSVCGTQTAWLFSMGFFSSFFDHGALVKVKTGALNLCAEL